MKNSKKKLFLFAGVLIIVAALFSFGIIFRSTAQTPNIFGGFVLNSFPCACSGNSLLTISGPVGGQFLYQWGAPQFPYASLPRSGVWTLGIYSPGGVCLVPDGKGCDPWGAPKGTITPVVGTSL